METLRQAFGLVPVQQAGSISEYDLVTMRTFFQPKGATSKANVLHSRSLLTIPIQPRSRFGARHVMRCCPP